MNPSKKLKTPAGYNGRTSTTAFDLGFEYAKRGILRGWTASQGTGLAVKLSSDKAQRSVAIVSDGAENAAVYMEIGDFVDVALQALPSDSWHAIVAIVKKTPTGNKTNPDNPESVAIFDIPANTTPLTDAEIEEHVKTSPGLGEFQSGKWARLCDVNVAGGASKIGEIRRGPIVENALPFSITGHASGNEIEIKDSAGARLLAYRILGDYNQKTYEGYNLYNSYLADGKSYATVRPDGVIELKGNPQPNGWTQTGVMLKEYIPTARVGDRLFVYVQGTARNNIYLEQARLVLATGWVEVDEEKLNSNVIIYGGYKRTDTVTIMVTKTADRPYEPYTGGEPAPSPIAPQDLNETEIKSIVFTGKNQFDKRLPLNLASLYADDDHTYKNSNRTQGFYIPCEPSTTYTVFKAPKSGYYRLSSSIEPPKLGSAWTVRVRGEDGRTATITTGPQDRYLYIRCWDDVLPYTPNDETVRTLQVQIGTDVGKIYTLTQPVRLGRVDNIRDVLEERDGVFGVMRNVGRFDANGTEDWTALNSSAGKKRYRLIIENYIKAVPDTKTVAQMLCNYLMPQTPSQSWENKEGITTGLDPKTNREIMVNIKQFANEPDAAALKAWLVEKHRNGAPLSVRYIKIVPTFEPLPEADQQALRSLRTFYPYTYIATQGLQEVEYITASAQPIIDSMPEPTVADGSITSEKLAYGAVTSTKIGPNAVYERSLSDEVRRKLYAYPEFTYRTVPAKKGTTPSPAYTHVKILEFTFEATVGGIYDVTALCNFIKADQITQEFSFFVRWTGGAEILGEAQCLVDPANYVKFTQKVAHSLIKATSANPTAYVGINSSNVGGSYELRAGYVTIERKK